MTDNDPLFGTSDDSSTSTDGAGTAPDSLATQFVGEGKKFSDVDTLLQAKLNSDKHISTVESENAELRAALAKKNELAELLSKSKDTPQEPTLRQTRLSRETL